MGLEDFQSEDDTGSNSSSTTNTSTSKTTTEDNNPSNADVGFHDIPQANARAIKAQIRALAENWKKQYSNRRFDTGEIVMYSAGKNVKKCNKTVMVFTTIQPVTTEDDIEESKDIHVVCWDFNKDEPITEGTYIDETDRWKTQLYKAIEKQLDILDRKT